MSGGQGGSVSLWLTMSGGQGGSVSLWLVMSGVLWSVVDVPHGTAVAPVTPEYGNGVCHFSNVFSPCFRWAAKTRLKTGNGTETVNIVERSCNGMVMETLF